MLTVYEKTLLEGWEDTHKKAQLTLWILLMLKKSPMHMTAIKEGIALHTNNTIIADDKSMYRALRRFTEAELIMYELEKSQGGPDKKIYHLTSIGKNVLTTFLQRNVAAIYFNENNSQLFI